MNNDPKPVMDNVFYYKLKNGEELISIEEEVGTYIKGIMTKVKTSPQTSENELVDRKRVLSELKTELQLEKKRYPKHIEMHYPMRAMIAPVSNKHGALHLSFWVSPSIFSQQVLHIPESEILLRTPVDLPARSYYFSIIRKYLVAYAKELIGGVSSSVDTIQNEESSYNDEDEVEEQEFDHSSKETEKVPYVVLGNGLKKTVH